LAFEAFEHHRFIFGGGHQARSGSFPATEKHLIALDEPMFL